MPGRYFLGVPFSYASTSMLVAGAGRGGRYVVGGIAEREAGMSSEPVGVPAAARGAR